MKHKIFSLVCFVFIFGFNQAKSQSISSSKEIYNFFETDEIVINFSDGPGNFTDWIAIYNEDEVPGTDPYLTWLYVDGSQLGFFGQKSGVVKFGLLPIGNYKVYFFEDDSFTVLASSSFKIAEEVIPENPHSTDSKSYYTLRAPKERRSEK